MILWLMTRSHTHTRSRDTGGQATASFEQAEADSADSRFPARILNWIEHVALCNRKCDASDRLKKLQQRSHYLRIELLKEIEVPRCLLSAAFRSFFRERRAWLPERVAGSPSEFHRILKSAHIRLETKFQTVLSNHVQLRPVT